jgi:hypothetical protein
VRLTTTAATLTANLSPGIDEDGGVEVSTAPLAAHQPAAPQNTSCINYLSSCQPETEEIEAGPWRTRTPAQVVERNVL